MFPGETPRVARELLYMGGCQERGLRNQTVRTDVEREGHQGNPQI